MTGFRFSLQLTRTTSRAQWLDQVRRAEDLGYDMVVTADHLTACAPPLLALTAAAQATSVLRLGTLVLNNDLRHPSVLAREAATLDVLSDGRAELGLGAGYAEEEYRRAGLRFDPPRVRIARLAESAGILRRLLDGEVVDHTGEHYEMRGESLEQRPSQGRIPLLVGGTGPTTLRLAARIADTVALAAPRGDRSSERFDRRIEWVREAAGAANRAPELQLLLAVSTITTSRAQAEDVLAARMPDLGPDKAQESPCALVGTPDRIAETVLARHARWGITHYTVRADAMTEFAPVLHRVRAQH